MYDVSNVCRCMCACVRMRVYVRTHVRVCVRTYVRTLVCMHVFVYSTIRRTWVQRLIQIFFMIVHFLMFSCGYTYIATWFDATYNMPKHVVLNKMLC